MKHALHIITEEAEFLSLAPEWDALHARSSVSASPFMTWDWVSLWWKYSSDHCQLRVGIVRDEGLGLRGIAPFVLGRGHEGARKRLRHLSFLGGLAPIVSEGMDLIIPRGEESVYGPILAQLIRRTQHEWDVLDLPFVQAESPTLQYLEAGSRHLGVLKDRFAPVPSLRIHLPEHAESAEKVLSNKSASMHRAAWRKMVTNHAARVLTCPGDLTPEHAFAELQRIHSLRFDHATSTFAVPAVLAFHKELLMRWLENGKAFITVVEADGRIGSARYCFVHENVCFDFQGGFDPAMHSYSLGRLTTVLAIAEGIRRGARIFDHLPGDQEHKRRLNDHQLTFRHLELFHPTRPAALLFTLMRKIKRIIKRKKEAQP